MSEIYEALARAKKHLATASDKSNAAAQAVGAGNAEASRLVEQLQAAIEAERVAAEQGLCTPDLTERVRAGQDAIRLHGYRLKKLEADYAMKQSDYTDAFRIQQAAELRVAHYEAQIAADAFDAALDAAAAAKREYLSKLATVRGLSADTYRYMPDNVGRAIRWSVTLTLLADGELFPGRDVNGNKIESAPDIRVLLNGMDRVPLLT